MQDIESSFRVNFVCRLYSFNLSLHCFVQILQVLYNLVTSQCKMTTFKLNTGASIPALGFGTWQDKQDQENAVAEALKAGVRHIDTARGKIPDG